MLRSSVPRLLRPAACVALLCLGSTDALLSARQALAATIVSDGVLGNSGNVMKADGTMESGSRALRKLRSSSLACPCGASVAT